MKISGRMALYVCPKVKAAESMSSYGSPSAKSSSVWKQSLRTIRIDYSNKNSLDEPYKANILTRYMAKSPCDKLLAWIRASPNVLS